MGLEPEDPRVIYIYTYEYKRYHTNTSIYIYKYIQLKTYIIESFYWSGSMLHADMPNKNYDWKITKAKRWETPRTTGGMPSAAMAAVGVINTAGTATVAISTGDAPVMLHWVKELVKSRWPTMIEAKQKGSLVSKKTQFSQISMCHLENLPLPVRGILSGMMMRGMTHNHAILYALLSYWLFTYYPLLRYLRHHTLQPIVSMDFQKES